MGKFAKADKQALSVLKRLQGSIINSVGTIRNYEQALKQVAQYCINQRISLRELTPNRALDYLQQRGEEIGQKTLDMERQAIQLIMQHVTHVLELDQRLPVIKSGHKQILHSRTYTPEQVKLIIQAQTPPHSLVSTSPKIRQI